MNPFQPVYNHREKKTLHFIANELGRSIGELHQIGYCHGDLHLHNVLVVETNTELHVSNSLIGDLLQKYQRPLMCLVRG